MKRERRRGVGRLSTRTAVSEREQGDTRWNKVEGRKIGWTKASDREEESSCAITWRGRVSLTKWTNRLAGLPCNRSRGLTRNQEHRPRLSKKPICPERTPNRPRRRLHPAACWCFHMRPLPLSLSIIYFSFTLPLSTRLLCTSPFLSRRYRTFYLRFSLSRPCGSPFALRSFIRYIRTSQGFVFLCRTGWRKFSTAGWIPRWKMESLEAAREWRDILRGWRVSPASC